MKLAQIARIESSLVLGTVVGMALSLIFFLLDKTGLANEETPLGAGE